MSTIVPTGDHLDTFYILDFDRTLADSDKLLEVFIAVANQYTDISYEQIKKIDADIKAKGDSFDTAKYVRDRLMNTDSLAQWHQLEKQFIHESRSLNMMLPGAIELLKFFDKRGEQYGILTYGNPLWQHLKLSACGFNHIRRIVTTNKRKGALISSWQQSDGTFALPSEYGNWFAERIVLVDDKAVSFEEFPGKPSSGYQVLDYASALPAQLGKVPGNVRHVTTLQEIVKLL